MSVLPNRRTFYYGLTGLPVALALFPVLVYIPRFYSSDMGIALTTVGTILFAQRLFDVITDPIVGYLSDHTRTRWGRRRPWIVAATPLMMLAVYRLFLPPAEVDAWYLFTWMMLLSLAITMMLIPYYAWAAELSPDYHERTVITGWRSLMGAVGSLSAQLIPAAAFFFFAFGGSANVLALVGISMLILMPLCVTATVTQTEETQTFHKSVTPLLPGLKLMFENGPFLRLVITFLVAHIGLAITTPLYLFFVADVLKAEAQAPYMLMFFYLSNVTAVPFWVWLSQQIGKHRAYVASFALIALAHPLYLLLGEGDFWYMLPITVLTGIAAGGFSATLAYSMKADVVDLDQLQTGENRAGLYMSAWSFAEKSAGFGGGIALIALGLFGFNTEAGAQNGPEELFVLRFLFSTFPSLFFLTAIAIIWKYPITERRQQEIRAELERRELQQAT